MSTVGVLLLLLVLLLLGLILLLLMLLMVSGLSVMTRVSRLDRAVTRADDCHPAIKLTTVVVMPATTYVQVQTLVTLSRPTHNWTRRSHEVSWIDSLFSELSFETSSDHLHRKYAIQIEQMPLE